MWFLLFATLRFMQIVGGVAVADVRIDSAFAAAIAELAPDGSSAIVDVTNHPEFVVGCAFSGVAPVGTRSTAAPGDTCTAPAATKQIVPTTIAAQLTAAEWTLLQTKIAAGNTASATAAARLLSAASVADAQSAVNVLAAQGVITAPRATTINTALAAAAVTP